VIEALKGSGHRDEAFWGTRKPMHGLPCVSYHAPMASKLGAHYKLPPVIYRSTLTPERRLGMKEQAHHPPSSRFAYQEFFLILASISALTWPLVTIQFPTKMPVCQVKTAPFGVPTRNNRVMVSGCPKTVALTEPTDMKPILWLKSSFESCSEPAALKLLSWVRRLACIAVRFCLF